MKNKMRRKNVVREERKGEDVQEATSALFPIIFDRQMSSSNMIMFVIL